jgi:hypothetical protein
MQLALDEAQALGMDGVPLGCLHEAAARIAISLGDEADFASHAARARAQYTRGGDPQLVAKYQRLVLDAGQRVHAAKSSAAAAAVPISDADSQVTIARGRRSAAGAASSAIETQPVLRRVEAGLSLLIEKSGAAGACVFALAGDLPVLLAQDGACDPGSVHASVTRYLDDERLAQSAEPRTYEVTRDAIRSHGLDAGGSDAHPLLLTAVRDGCSVVAGVLVLWQLPAGSVPSWPLISELAEAVLDRAPAVAPHGDG